MQPLRCHLYFEEQESEDKLDNYTNKYKLYKLQMKYYYINI